MILWVTCPNPDSCMLYGLSTPKLYMIPAPAVKRFRPVIRVFSALFKPLFNMLFSIVFSLMFRLVFSLLFTCLFSYMFRLVFMPVFS
jgi:hypothetical protein